MSIRHLMITCLLLGTTATPAGAQVVKWPTFAAHRCYVSRTPERAFLSGQPLPQYLLMQAPDSATPPVRKGGMARVVYPGWAADYFWRPGTARGVLRLVAPGIDTSDEMVLIPVGDGVRGRALYHGCCGGPPEPRAIEAASIPCDSVPRRLVLVR